LKGLLLQEAILPVTQPTVLISELKMPYWYTARNVHSSSTG